MRHAICNETFEGWDHARICRQVAELGYEGLEIAPFTLGAPIAEISPRERRQLRAEAEAVGVTIMGLHWLLAKTEGLQLTSPDAAIRARTAVYLGDLARLCADLGGKVLVFGSPLQRRIPSGARRGQAVEWAIETFAKLQPVLAETGVRLCLEPLAPSETDFINTCAEALEIIERLDNTSFLLHLDVKAMCSEETPATELIRRHGGRAGHFHANDANRRGPGFGDTDFVPLFRALRGSGYAGWVSVEVFDYSPDPVTIAHDSMRYMKECERRAAAD